MAVLKLDPGAAAAVIGVGAFELCKLYTDTAPTVAECRASQTGTDVHQQLVDADITMGPLALIIGGTMSLLIRDWSPLVIMFVVFGAISLLRHWMLNSPN